MALAQATNALEQAMGHGDNSITRQDVTNYDAPSTGDSSKSMKALTWQGKNTVKVIDVPVPKIIEDTDVILKVTGSTVCGSDLHLLHGVVVEMSKGDVLGHEFCGVVDSVGSAVQKVQIGKRYVASFQIACGDCFFCKQKLSSQCERTNSNTLAKAMYGGRTAGMFGYSHFTGGFAGGQAEYVRVPLGDVNLLEIPEAVPDEKALYLSDVLCTSYNAVKDTAVYPGDTVAIFGAGAIGQMVAVFALDEGADKIVFVDTEPRTSLIKTKFNEPKDAAKIGVIDYKEAAKEAGGVVAALKKACNGGRGPDAALECAAGEYAKGWAHWLEMALGAETDTSEIINEMVEGVRNYGRCGITGVYVGYTNHFAIGSLMQRGVRLIGNGQAPVHKYWEHLLSKIQDGSLDPLAMVSHRVRLEDLETVYAKFNNREDNIQKVFIETKFSGPAVGPQLTRYQ